MIRKISLIGASTILIGSGLLIGASTSPAHAATAKPATAYSCTVHGIGYGGVDGDPDGLQATCYDTPTGEWQLEIYCISERTSQQVNEYSAAVYGNNTIGAYCPGHQWFVGGYDILNLQ